MKKMMAKIKRRIGAIRDLPTLPSVIHEFHRVAEDPDAGMERIAEVIQKDPVLTGKVLRIVNSAFYGLQQKIGTLRLALVILGMKQIRHLVIGVSVMSVFPPKPGRPTFDRNRFWTHSAGVGMISRMVAARAQAMFDGVEFTAGLLHDIGKVVLDEYFHEDFTEALARSEKKGIPLYEAEDEVFGVTHAQVGEWVAGHWNLPEELCEAIAFHHKPERAERNMVLTSVVHLANLLARMKGVGFSGDRASVRIEENVGWQILTTKCPPLADVDLESFILDLDREIAKGKEFLDLSTETQTHRRNGEHWGE